MRAQVVPSLTAGSLPRHWRSATGASGTPGNGCCAATRTTGQLPGGRSSALTYKENWPTSPRQPWCWPASGTLHHTGDHERHRQRIPGATYQELPGTPHMQTLEKPELVAAALADFLPQS